MSKSLQRSATTNQTPEQTTEHRSGRETADQSSGPAATVFRNSVSRGNSFAGDIVARDATGDLERAADPGATAEAGFSGGGEVPHRQEMEGFFGQSFADVSATTGGAAAGACEDLGANAYAVGNQVAFADSNPDKSLVAHELTHVVQQQGGTAGGVQQSAKVSSPGDASEREASAVASAFNAGRAMPSIGSGGEQVALYPALDAEDFWERLRSQAASETCNAVLGVNTAALNQLDADLRAGGEDPATKGMNVDVIDFALDIAGAAPPVKFGFKMIQRVYGILNAQRSGTIQLSVFQAGVRDAHQAFVRGIPRDMSQVSENSDELFTRFKEMMDAETDANRTAKRQEAVTLLTSVDNNLPDYRHVMRPLISAWIAGAQDQPIAEATVDLPDVNGLQAGYLRIYVQITPDMYGRYSSHRFSAINIDDIDLPSGTKQALTTAYGANHYLDELPLGGRINLTMGSTMVIYDKTTNAPSSNLDGWTPRTVGVSERFSQTTIENRTEMYREHIRPRVEHLQADD